MSREPLLDLRLLMVAAGLAVLTLGVQYVVRPEIGLHGWAAWTAWAPSLFFSAGCVIAALAVRNGRAHLVVAGSIGFALAFELIQRWHPTLTFSGEDLAASLAGICAAFPARALVTGGWEEVGI